MWQTIFQRTEQWLDQTVASTQFTQWLTAYALYIIFQIRVLKTAENFLDVRRMLVRYVMARSMASRELPQSPPALR